MGSLVIVELEVISQTRRQSRHSAIVIEIDMLILDAAPEALNEDVIKGSATTSHAKIDFVGLQFTGKIVGGELHALIGVEDRRLPLL